MNCFKTMCMATMAVAMNAQAGAPTQVTHPTWADNAVIYEVNVRQYSEEGTFAQVTENLQRLNELGVDIIWLMPIHPISELNRKGGLGSYYAVANYKSVNPEFGDIDDLRTLVKKAHSLNMKVIIDWVPNHTGCDNAWVKNFPDRYARNEKGEMFGPFDWTDVYKLDYTKADTRQAMIDAMSFWLREADIDGFRCDVAGQVPVEFWNECRPALEKTKKDIFMLAEATEPFLMEKAFDMDYNWPMKDLMNRVAYTAGQYTYKADGESAPKKMEAAHARDIVDLLDSQAEEYPAGSIMMNMVTNHDLNSWEGTEFQRYGSLTPAMAVLTFALPGMPLIYTGQETGMDRALEFFVKDTAPTWEPRNEYFTFYKDLCALKHARPELSVKPGVAEFSYYGVADEDVIVFSRQSGKSTTIVGVNLGSKTKPVKFTAGAPSVKGAVDHATGKAVKALPKTLNAGEYFIYTVN